MSDEINKVLNILRNMRPSSKDLVKIKVLMACYDGWKSTHDIRKITKLGLQVELRLNGLMMDDLLECERFKLLTATEKYYKRNEYRTTKKGVAYITALMK
jgi:hypothetical protein